MTSIELQLCDIQGRLFKLSVQKGIGSAEFTKVFVLLRGGRGLPVLKK